MAFRDPITAVADDYARQLADQAIADAATAQARAEQTPTELDTGGTGPRVVISRTGGVEGGGAVLLYPNTSSAPGLLEAGSDTAGAFAAISSPPNVDGYRSSLLLRGVDVGDEGAFLDLPPGANFYVSGAPLLQPARAWNLSRRVHTTAIENSFGTTGFVSLIDQTIANAPAGDYRIGLTLLLRNSGGLAGGNVRLLVPGVVQLLGGDPSITFTTGWQTFSFDTSYTHTVGNLRLQALVYCSGGTPIIQTVGSEIAVSYLGPRS